jgi:sporulation protein YabP
MAETLIEYEMPHSIILEERKKLSVNGVTDVENFDETMIIMQTSKGILTVRGENIHIDKLNLESGELALNGEIYSIDYEDKIVSKGGLFSRMFG